MIKIEDKLKLLMKVYLETRMAFKLENYKTATPKTTFKFNNQTCSVWPVEGVIGRDVMEVMVYRFDEWAPDSYSIVMIINNMSWICSLTSQTNIKLSQIDDPETSRLFKESMLVAYIDDMLRKGELEIS